MLSTLEFLAARDAAIAELESDPLKADPYLDLLIANVPGILEPHVLKAIGCFCTSRLDEAHAAAKYAFALAPENLIVRNLLLAINGAFPNSDVKPGASVSLAFYYLCPSSFEYAVQCPMQAQVRESPKLGGSTLPPLTIVKNASVKGPAGLLVSQDGTVLRDSSLYSNLMRGMKLVPNPMAPTDSSLIRRGEFAPLCRVWSDNFFHWMMEYLNGAMILEASGFRGTYLISAPREFVTTSLERLGISPDRIEVYGGQEFAAELLVIPPRITAEALSNYPGLVRHYREALAPRGTAKSKYGERIYATRNPATCSRTVLNETELRPIISQYGFQVVDMETLTLNEQIDAVASASALIGPHGAAMIHCLFMPNHSLVVELFSPTYTNPCMLPVIEALDHRYYMVPSVTPGSYEHGDVCAFIPAIRHLLHQELGG